MNLVALRNHSGQAVQIVLTGKTISLIAYGWALVNLNNVQYAEFLVHPKVQDGTVFKMRFFSL